MPSNYTSPQVVIKEIDLSAIANAAVGNPYLVLGEAQYGRDDQAVLITNKANYVNMFGRTDSSMPGTYAAMEYLSFGNQLYYKRVTSTKFVKIASSASVTLTKSGSTMTLSGTISPYLTGDSTQTPVALIIKDTTGVVAQFKAYVTSWSSGNIYNILWDAYGTDYNQFVTGATLALTADIYVSHAEPAFNSNLMFLKSGQTPVAFTVTYDATERTNWNAGVGIDADAYYVTSVTATGAYGSNLPLTATPTTGGSVDAGVHLYRFTFTNSSTESAASIEVSATTDVTNNAVDIVFPALPTGYTGYNLYRSAAGADVFYKVNTTPILIGTYTDTLADATLTTQATLPTCPISVSINGSAMPITTAGTDNAHYVLLASDGSVKGEYYYQVFQSTSVKATWIKGTSPALAVGDILYKVIQISASSYPNSQSYLIGDGITTGTSITETILESSLVPFSAATTTPRRVVIYTGTGTYTVPSTDSMKAYRTIVGSDYYYYADAAFDRYALKLRGRGTYGNDYDAYTAYNQNTTEYEVLIANSAGTIFERWVDTSLTNLVQRVNESSDYMTLVQISDLSSTTDLVSFDTTFTTLTGTAYYKAALAGGYDGYFAVEEGDFIANLDAGVAGAKYAVDPDFSDLVVSTTDIANNESSIDFTVLAVPGWSSSSTLAGVMDTLVTSRMFAVALYDIPYGLKVSQAIDYRNNQLAGLASSYGAIFYNYGKVYDAVIQANVWLPPTVFAVRALAYTDTTGTPFAAAAGARRGLVPEVSALENYPSLGDRDALTSVQINPVAKVSNQIMVYGNKTTQRIKSMLSNLNVRRTIITGEKLVYVASHNSLFEPNDALERTRILLMLQPIFDRIRQERGLLAFGIFDATTDADVADNIARFRIELQPTPDIEVIVHDVVIKSPTQAISGSSTI